MEVKHPDSNSFPRILIAEDERITAHHLRHVLTRFGYEVVAVASSNFQMMIPARACSEPVIVPVLTTSTARNKF
jgi:CheY-like chemotaxis protein